MFPIRDHNPSGRRPYVTYALIVANVVVFVMMLPLRADPYAEAVFYQTWALIPAKGDWGGYLTSQFLHGGILHLAGNMLFLWVFGDNIEDELGHAPFLGFYLLSGIAAGLAQSLPDPTSQIPMVGASGAIAGVMGGYLLMFPKARIDVLVIFVIILKVFPVPAWIVLGIWFGLQVFSGASTPGDGGGVAYWAHAGGFVAGLVMMVPFWLKRGGTEFWQRTHGLPPHPEATYPIGRSSVPAAGRRRR
jgi:membrane associated rhomboid family serine protease